jgi:diguanylate cyclase (GGDEF)-like protein
MRLADVSEPVMRTEKPLHVLLVRDSSQQQGAAIERLLRFHPNVELAIVDDDAEGEQKAVSRNWDLVFVAVDHDVRFLPALRERVHHTALIAYGPTAERAARALGAQRRGSRDRKIAQLVLRMTRDGAERKRAEQRLEYVSRHDTLTGLPNRDLLAAELNYALGHARRHRRSVAVALLDIDRFESVNGPLGREAGDALLRTVAARLKLLVGKADSVARVGGDAFALVLADLGDPMDATRIAAKIVAAFATPFYLDGGTIHLTASLGLALHPADGTSVEALLRNAATAMHRARDRGNCYQCYAPEMTERARERLDLELDLHRALERGEFTLHFQPYFESQGRYVAGAEALLRWRHPEKGLVAPATFIPLAEEIGLIVPLGAWALEAACAEAHLWLKMGLELPVSVNLSARQFGASGLVETIAAALARNRLEPRLLTVEITESALLENTDDVLKTLLAIKQLGVRIAIDDFGTSYSSLGYVKRFAADCLKIDRTFVQGVATNDNDVAIARAIIGMAHALNMRVVAEGVETHDQADKLRTLGCDFLQGFAFAKPLCGAELLELLRSTRVGRAARALVDPRRGPLTVGPARDEVATGPRRALPER